eukprot:TRINITY_DN25871_c0_g1_i1.p1 TRINITY_DN25871_c0_g1~~TRINITY_DN25871_c0_g1_i1.p1  ORF type:complete len:116 (+),score=9.48 TRINITY_DN25871_c0_g1_i1:90-437(+)
MCTSPNYVKICDQCMKVEPIASVSEWVARNHCGTCQRDTAWSLYQNITESNSAAPTKEDTSTIIADGSISFLEFSKREHTSSDLNTYADINGLPVRCGLLEYDVWSHLTKGVFPK